MATIRLVFMFSWFLFLHYIVETIGIILKWRNLLKFYFKLKIVNFDCFDYFFAFFCSKCIKSVAIDAKRRFASVFKLCSECVISNEDVSIALANFAAHAGF